MQYAISRRLALASSLAFAVGALVVPANATIKIPDDVAARLTPEQADAYRAYLQARSAFDRQLEMYWALIEERRDNRRRKRAKQQPIDATDYVQTQPPKYAGLPLSPEVAKVLSELRPSEPEKPMAVVADYVAAAREQFGFTPWLTTERDFKRRYAIEALNAGLNKMQVVRVYALETGGDGTFDMQAGFNPLSRQGRAISSALGYAQLLAANSTSELVKHGDEFLRRLDYLANQPGMQRDHVQHWQWKAGILRRMLAAARSVPNEWNHHRRFALTGPGMAIHTLNMDADIGPWLQALKLKGILQIAADAGRSQLTGAELEIMNLAGPRSGLEMMEPVGRTMPTANVFEQAGYYRNSIVREKSGAELLKALDDRMDVSIKRSGAVEFLAVFDEVIGAIRPQPERAADARLPTTLQGTLDTTR